MNQTRSFHLRQPHNAVNKLRGMEKLTDQGGFIREWFTGQLKACINEEVFCVTQGCTGLGEFCIDVAEEVEKARQVVDGDYASGNEKVPDRDFKAWYLSATAGITLAERKEAKEGVRTRIRLSPETRSLLERFSVLERRVIWARFGLDGEKKLRNAAEIAGLPDFDCRPEYIVMVLEKIGRIMGKCQKERKAFDLDRETWCQKSRKEKADEG